MSGKRRETTGSVWSIPSVSRPTTSAATLRSTRTSSCANVATQCPPLRRNIFFPHPICRIVGTPCRSTPVDRGPETVSVQLVGVHLHALPRADGNHRLAVRVHIHHQFLGLF